MKVIETRENGTKRVITMNTEPSLTQQHHKDECDVNNIIKKYQKTGQLTHVARSQGVYADLSEIPDYMDSLNKVIKAKEAFMTLPAHVRKRFGNDPKELVEFVQDPKNLDEGIKLGIFNKPSKNAAEPEPSAATPPTTEKK